MRLLALRFPIRTSPDQRLLGTSPKRIAAKLRPSSPFEAKASTIRPCFPLGNLEITKPRSARKFQITIFKSQTNFKI